MRNNSMPQTSGWASDRGQSHVQTAERSMEQALKNAETIITRSYLKYLSHCRLTELPGELETVDIASCGSLFQLKRLVLNQEEDFLDKLVTVVNVVSAIDASLAVLIHSDGIKTEYYLGIISKNYQKDQVRIAANKEAFYGALAGNLPGIALEEINQKTDIPKLEKEIFHKEGCCCAISGIGARRDTKETGMNGYVQGIENLADSLKGRRYTILLIADPAGTDRVQEMKQGYELLHTQLSEYAGYTMTCSESDTRSLSKARTHSVSEGISKGIAMTQGTSRTKGWSVSDTMGIYAGGSAGISAGPKDVGSVQLGINAGRNKSRSTADNYSHTETRSWTNSQNRSEQTGYSVSETASDAKTSGASLQIGFQNRSVKALLDKIDIHLGRLDLCESFGAFECAAYVLADKKEDALAAAASYYALMRGRDSCAQASQIHLWDKPKEADAVKEYLRSFVHPRFCINEAAEHKDQIIVTPASVIGGNELALQIGLPKKSVNGIMVIPMAAFGRNIPDTEWEDSLYLGSLHHMGQDENHMMQETGTAGNGAAGHAVSIPIKELCKHTFITGATGAGKSTAIYSMLDQLARHAASGNSLEKIKFMVIEPAKGEYKERFGSYENVRVFGTNSKKTPLIRLDPFSFPDDVHVLEHMERLIEIFNVCWPMYAAMPAVLKDAVEEAYCAAGWDLEASECRYTDSNGRKLYPSFVDVLEKVREVMERSEYSADSKGDYKGALCTRLKSLTNGLYRKIFTSDEIPAEELFDQNVIVDLSRTGFAETKALIMGLLVIKLQEYRMSSTAGSNQALRHITVLEEAHHILKRTSADQNMESANLTGRSVEMLANSIAEMRTYGEGFVVSDQAPGLLDLSVIRNTGTKIILRLPDQSDRELAGRAAGLNEHQVRELAKLENYVAAVHQNGWMEPVLCHIAKDPVPCTAYTYVPETEEETVPVETYIGYLGMTFSERKKLDRVFVEQLKQGIWKLLIPAESKAAFLKFMDAQTSVERRELAAKAVYGILNAETISGLLKNRKNGIDGLCYQDICRKIEPDLSFLSERERNFVIALLLTEIDGGNSRAEKLYPAFVKFLKGY